MDYKISYAITVKDELKESKELIDYLLSKKKVKDEIVVLFDQKNGSEEVADMLTEYSKLPNFQFWRGFFEGHFADWKNKLKEYCSGDYIFQIDADEIPTPECINSIRFVLNNNPTVEVLLVPRVNTVEGLTQEHINKWRWNVNEKGWVNFPDYQWRVWKNLPQIKWINKVHEVLTGFETFAKLPAAYEYCLKHPKTIERQEKQNSYYDTLL